MTSQVRIPILADLLSRGDGTFVLRPIVPDGSLETWLGVKEAAQILSVAPRSLYQYLGVYLVYRRPLASKVEVSLGSVRAFRAATNDPEFWESRTSQAKLKKAVEVEMGKLAAGSMQGV